MASVASVWSVERWKGGFDLNETEYLDLRGWIALEMKILFTFWTGVLWGRVSFVY